MTTMNNIEDYQNLVELLKMALEFYGNAENYKTERGVFNIINIDGGSQARFALDKIKELEKTYVDMKTEYVDVGNKTPEEIFNIIDKLKNG